MSQSLWFRKAVEMMYKISIAPPAQQGFLRDLYDEAISRSTDEGKIVRDLMHASILAGNATYCCERSKGKSQEDAFDLSREYVLSLKK